MKSGVGMGTDRILFYLFLFYFLGGGEGVNDVWEGIVVSTEAWGNSSRAVFARHDPARGPPLHFSLSDMTSLLYFPLLFVLVRLLGRRLNYLEII